MITANIKIVNIEYEKTLQQLFPIIRERLGAVESTDLIIRLFQKLDDAALPVLLGIMDRLPERTRNELLAICLDTYSDKLCEKLNEELAKHPYGRFLQAGSVSVERQGEALYLWISQVQVDYKGLVKEKMGGTVGGIASLLVGEKMEKMALELLWTEESRGKLIELLQGTLDKYGFAMGLADFQMMQDHETYEDFVEAEKHLILTDELETDILDALAGYLRDRADEGQE